MSGPWAQAAPRRGVNPPPVCFNCNEEGHFVVNCPKPSKLNTGAFPVPPVQQRPPQPPPYNGYSGSSQLAYQPQSQYSTQGPNQHFGHPPPQYHGPSPPSQVYGPTPVSGHYSQPGFQQPPVHNSYPSQNPNIQYGPAGYSTPSYGYGQPPFHDYPQPPVTPSPQSNGYAYHAGSHPPQQWEQPPPVHSMHPQQYGDQYQGGYPGHGGFNAAHSHQTAPSQIPQMPTSFSSNHNPQRGPSRSSSMSVPNDSSSAFGQKHQSRSQSFVNSTGGGIENEGQVNPQDVHNASNPFSPEPITDDEQFLWDFSKIFKESQKVEFVALAQPLATSFEVTPVPQIDTRSKRSISRLARSDNQKEFMISIRNAPYWSFAQEDPVFADLKLDSPLIPIEDLPSWIMKRHGLEAVHSDVAPEDSSRKRSRSDDLLDNTTTTRGDKSDGSHTIKRQKKKEIEDSDDVMIESLEHNGSLLPVLDRSRTPCVGVIDDAWAPEPGEVGSASSPADPAEALLASLGVTGEAKPIRESDLSALADQTLSHGLAENVRSYSGNVSSTEVGNMGESTYGHTADQQSSKEFSTLSSHGASSTHPRHDSQGSSSQQDPERLGLHRSESWSTGRPSGTPYSYQASNVSRPNSGNVAAPPPPPYPHYPQRSASYSTPADGQTPYYNSSLVSQYNGYHNGGYNQGNHGYPQPPYIHNQNSNGQLGHHQYHYLQVQGAPSHGSHAWSHGPAEPANSGIHPPSMSNHPPSQHPPNSGVQGSFQSSNGYHDPPQSELNPVSQRSLVESPAERSNSNSLKEQPQVATKSNIMHVQSDQEQPLRIVTNQSSTQAPLRQDSGYMSASTRGSYSNGSEENNAINPDFRSKENKDSQIAKIESAPSSMPSITGTDQESDSESGSPLSPTSAEILGKLEGKPNHKKSSRWGPNGDRKVRRPQPVVAEAYSRRW